MTLHAHVALLLSGAAWLAAPALAQTDGLGKGVRAAPAGAAAPAYSGGREKLVLGMPKTYGKSETMLLWGDYFSHLSRCANVDLQNSLGNSLDRSSNVDVLGEKELVDGILSGAVQLAQVNPGLAAQLVAAGQPAPFAVPGN